MISASFPPLLKRELTSIFFSPIAYALLAIFYLISGYFFYTDCVIYSLMGVELSRMAQIMGPQELTIGEHFITPYFGNISVILLMLLPLVTMRLYSEEKKSGTIEILYTWPIKDVDILLSKYMAGILFFLALLAGTIPLMGLLAIYTELPTSTLLSCYLGLFLLGSAFISLGLLISTLTENQIVAGAVTFGVLLMFWALSFGVDRKSGAVADILKELSILKHLEPFLAGMINSTDICYYIIFSMLALFLTARVIEADRGNG